MISGIQQSDSKPLDQHSDKEKTRITAKRIALIEIFRDSKRQTALALFHESIDSEQKRLMHEFETVALPSIGNAVQETYRKRGLAAPMTKSHFNRFLASHFFGVAWETPTDTDLIDFSLGQNQSSL